jgi:hypothetical protein
MANSSSGIPSHKTQLHVIQLLTGWTLREIDNLFAGNELTDAVNELDERQWPVGGSSRRHSAASYHAALDLSDPNQRARLLRVYDDVLAADPESEQSRQLRRLLRRDGIRIAGDGAIEGAELELPSPGPFDASRLPDFSLIQDSEVLREHAMRMQRALGQRDPADALLAGRELLETVCKLVAKDYGKPIPKNASLGQLYSIAADELGLKAAAVEGDTEASKAARKVLQGLASIADGMGELRTRIGRGHGRTDKSPARQRHAELGTSASATLALFILDTWHERRKSS